jgi:3-hydroxyisobutyrate dehydrogenase-like beta-hydroxyacid dehydrogenase
MNKIAVVGTGIMGSGIATNYLKDGYDVIVWNRSAAKTDSLKNDGAHVASSPQEATEFADIIFEVTANDASSQSVWQGTDGILAAANTSKVLITSATLSIDWTTQLAKLCQADSYQFLDMPLTGGRVAAEDGSLTLLVGGKKATLDAITGDLVPISSRVLYFGESGSGMKYKLILNSLQAAHMAAFREALAVAISQGLDPQKVGPALCERPGGVPTHIAWDAYNAKPLPLTFSVDWITKDLEYAKQMNGSTKTDFLDDTLAIFKKAQSEGHGSEDWGIITKDLK